MLISPSIITSLQPTWITSMVASLRNQLRQLAAGPSSLCDQAFLSEFHPYGSVRACASRFVMYNGTPFRQAVRNGMNVTRMQRGDQAVRQLQAPIAAMVVQETDLTPADASNHIGQDVVTTVGQAAVLPFTAAQMQKLAPTLSTASIQPQVLPSTTPSISPTSVPLITMPGGSGGAPAPTSILQQVASTASGGSSVPGLQTTKTVDGKTFCIVTPAGLQILQTMPVPMYLGAKPLPIGGKTIAPGNWATKDNSGAVAAAPTTSALFLASMQKQNLGVVGAGGILWATNALDDVVAATAADPTTCVVTEPPQGWATGGAGKWLLYYVAGVLVLGGGYLLLRKQKKAAGP